MTSSTTTPTRTAPTLDYEATWWARGCRHIAGLDEVGRGAWAGPVVAAAVVLPADPAIAALLVGVRDSKECTAAARERLAALIRAHAVAVAVGLCGPATIDTAGLLPATAEAMRQALAGLRTAPDHVLLDGLPLPHLARAHTPIVHGDALSLSIAAASIVAKVTRDRLMAELDAAHRGYDFGRHKGYGTAAHQDALRQLGPCAAHRLSVAPVAAVAAQSWV